MLAAAGQLAKDKAMSCRYCILTADVVNGRRLAETWQTTDQATSKDTTNK